MEGIAQEIAEIEAAIDRLNVTDVNDAAFGKAWALQMEIDRLASFGRLREPAIDYDCRIAGCGGYGQSII
ncbi:MAG: hypothetical protein U1E59_03635 [Amaricoccus sp.]